MKGFVSLPIIIVVLVLISVGAVGFVKFHPSNPTPKVVEQASPSAQVASASASLSPTPSPSATPKVSVVPTAALVDCVGPDGKHVSLTKTQCDSFQKAWATPTPSPSASTTSSSSSGGCSDYNLGGDLGTLTVSIQADNGSLSGDAAVTINHKYNCPGVDPGFPLIQVIRQGSTSTTFSGMRPGPFHIDVSYHGNSSGQDVGINSGSNSTSVTVHN